MSNDDFEITTATAGIITWDQHWLQLLKEMNQDAWDEFVTNYAADLRRDIGASLKKRGLPADLTEDIEQETWRVAVQKIHDFDAESIEKLYHWLRVIALNRIRMMLRKQQDDEIAFEEIEEYEFSGGISLDHFLYTNDLSADSPEDILLLRERLSALETALHELSPRDREILLRRLMCGETPRDLAEDYCLAPRSISMILLRSKQTLEKHIAAMDLFNTERDADG